MKKLKIGLLTTSIDGRKVMGTALYTRKIVEYLKKRRDEINLYCIHYRSALKDSIYENVPEIFIPEIKLPTRGSKLISEILFMLREKYSFDIIHFPHQRLYPGFIFSSAKKRVVTIHDAGSRVLKLPSHLSRSLFDFSLRFLQFKIDGVVTVSEFSKKEINKYYHIPNEKIYVNYHGIEKNFRPLDNLSAKELARFRLKYNIYDNYILDVSRIQPHKNIKNLILAYSQLGKIINDYKLVIAGGSHWRAEEVIKLINDLKLNERVKIIDYVEIEDLPILYNLAKVLVFPSLHEGFGFPVLEAFACGCPVIASNCTALPEIANGAAYLINPHNPDEIAQAVRKILADKNLCQKLIEKGFKRVKEFSWDKSINQLINIYREILWKRIF